MLSAERAFEQLRPRYDSAGRLVAGEPDLKGVPFSAFRTLAQPLRFRLPATVDFDNPASVGPLPRNFAAGAIVYAITASAVPETQPVQPVLWPRQRFEIQLNYTQGDALTNERGSADAILGPGEGTIFPGKALYMPPQQNIFTTVFNLTPEVLRVTVAFHTLVWRFAQ